jgi:hypothetical protein
VTPEKRTCPVCGCEGRIVRTPKRGGGEMISVIWLRQNGTAWTDAHVSAEDLASPDFGCGFDGSDPGTLEIGE